MSASVSLQSAFAAHPASEGADETALMAAVVARAPAALGAARAQLFVVAADGGGELWSARGDGAAEPVIDGGDDGSEVVRVPWATLEREARADLGGDTARGDHRDDGARPERERDDRGGEAPAARGGKASDGLGLVIADERDALGGGALPRADALGEHPGADRNV